MTNQNHRLYNSDESVINAIKYGDENVWEYVYKSSEHQIRNVALRNNVSHEAADDLIQDTIITFFKRVMEPQFALSSELPTFLVGIAKNICRNNLKKKRELRIEDHTPEPIEDNFNPSREAHKISKDILRKSSHICGKILRLYYLFKMSMVEIAEQLDYSNANTAKNQKAKCVKKIREQYFAYAE
jgi:RNA polymerase sigma factor (sigma-70 family)